MPVSQLVVLVLGPVALAVWLDVRLAEHRPTTLPGLGLVTASAAVGCTLVGAPLAAFAGRVAGGRPGVALFLAAAVGCLTYAFLAGVWLVRLGAATLAQRRR